METSATGNANSLVLAGDNLVILAQFPSRTISYFGLVLLGESVL